MADLYRKYGKWVVLLVLVVLVKLLSLNSNWVEWNYSRGFYPAISAVLRFLTGWIPFSLGDIAYALAVVWVLWKLVKHTRALFQRKVTGRSFLKGLGKTLFLLLSIYVIFNICWGVNYNRKGIAAQLELKIDTFSMADLENLNQLLVEKVNACKQSLVNNKVVYPGNRELFERTATAYQNVEKQYPFLHYKPVSIKSSLWGWLGNYTGFLGYYNPFSGEAQVNTTIPRFLLPFTTCHEVAHQLGYAKENEANFVGYLAASASSDTIFRYSTYLDLFLYANRTLRLNGFLQNDTTIANKYREQLIPEIKEDLETWSKFNARHKNPFEPLIRKGYSLYLKSNGQPKGMRSYDEVTSFMMAYYKKYGRI